MQVNETKKFSIYKKKLKNETFLLSKLEETLLLLKKDFTHEPLNFKKINCKKDKFRHSIRIIGTQYRVLLSVHNEIIDLHCICNHDEYDRLNKNC